MSSIRSSVKATSIPSSRTVRTSSLGSRISTSAPKISSFSSRAEAPAFPPQHQDLPTIVSDRVFLSSVPEISSVRSIAKVTSIPSTVALSSGYSTFGSSRRYSCPLPCLSLQFRAGGLALPSSAKLSSVSRSMRISSVPSSVQRSSIPHTFGSSLPFRTIFGTYYFNSKGSSPLLQQLLGPKQSSTKYTFVCKTFLYSKQNCTHRCPVILQIVFDSSKQ